MKLSEFNKLPLNKKEQYINSFVSGKPGISNALVFEGYTIIFTCSVNGKLLKATGYIQTEEEKRDAIKLLKGKEVVALDCTRMPGIKNVIHQKLLRATNRYN